MENCAIKIIKKLSCCITGKSIRSSTSQLQQQQQQLQLQGLPPQQQPRREAKQLLPTTTPRDTQPRPGAQSGTTTLKIKRLLVLPATTEKDTVDYASAKKSASVVSEKEEKEKCIDNNYGGDMVQLPQDQLKSDSSRCGVAMSVAVDDRVIGERSSVIDVQKRNNNSTTSTVDTMKKANKDINLSTDIDRSFAIVNGAEDDDEDPYAELDMYLEKVKVCHCPSVL